MMERLTAGQRQGAAVGLLLLLLAALYIVFIQPLVSVYGDYGERIADLQNRLAGYERVASRSTELQQQFVRLKGQLSKQQRGYLQGNTRALAAAEMQQHVKKVVEANAGRLNSIQIMPDTTEDGGEADAKQPVSIKVQMLGSTETVQRVFHTLEAGQPRMFVDQVYLRGRNAYQFRPGKPPNDELDIRFSLSGFMALEKS
jgi:general secretion pathway protein M